MNDNIIKENRGSKYVFPIIILRYPRVVIRLNVSKEGCFLDFCFFTFLRYLIYFMVKIKKGKNSRNKGFSYFFRLLTEGSGSRSRSRIFLGLFYVTMLAGYISSTQQQNTFSQLSRIISPHILSLICAVPWWRPSTRSMPRRKMWPIDGKFADGIHFAAGVIDTGGACYENLLKFTNFLKDSVLRKFSKRYQFMFLLFLLLLKNTSCLPSEPFFIFCYEMRGRT